MEDQEDFGLVLLMRGCAAERSRADVMLGRTAL